MLLEAENLGKDYGDLVAVDEVGFQVEAGEVFGLLGPNGAGKTTTISMIAGLVTPSRGAARIAGHDVQGDAFAARRQLGLVPQELALYHELSARQNLQFFASLYELRGQELSKAVDWALDVAGLGERADVPVCTFSGGMKRRLNLVVGLVHRPRLVILDEPTVGVDPQSRNFLFGIITRLSQDEGMTVLYTSHYMEEVQTLCKRVAILDHGRVVAADTVDALLAAHAEPTLTIDYRGPEARVRDVLGDRPVALEPGRITLPTPESLGALLARLESASMEIVRVSSSEANLEKVFLNLTGHSLRDEQ